MLFVLLAGLVSLMIASAARSAEFEISASSFTTDGQVNGSSVTYFGGMLTAPASPSVTQLPNTPGGLYFDGTRYRVWDNPTSAWVSLTTGTAGGLLPWSELTSYPGACSGNQVVTGVGPALTCATPSGTLSGGVAGYYGKWTGGAVMGIGNVVDNGASVTMIANSTLTVSGSAFSVGGSTLVVFGGNVGIGTTTSAGIFTVGNGTMTVLSSGSVGIGTSAPWSDGRLQVRTGVDQNFTVSGPNSLTDGVVLQSFNDTVTANKGFEVRGSTIALMIGNVGIGTTAPAARLQVAGAIQAKNIALGITPTTTGTWAVLPGSLGNATDGNTATVTTAGQTIQTASGLSNINIDLGAVYRGIIYFQGGAWASGGATSTTVLSYSQDPAFNNSQWDTWTNTCTAECPVFFAKPFYGRYIAVSCYTSNAANPDNCVIYDLTAALYQ